MAEVEIEAILGQTLRAMMAVGKKIERDANFGTGADARWE
jgi:hypothetical protein